MSYSEVPDSSVEFLNEFISRHPQLKPAEEERYVRQFRFAFDTKTQLLKERNRLRAELAESDPGLANFYLVQELHEVEALLLQDPQIKRIPYYRNKLVEHNLRLIIKVANHYKTKGLPIDDLIQEGTLGFVRAIEKFDPREGVKLGTYATWWVRQKITRALSNKTRLIRLPVHVAAQVTKVLQYIRQEHLDVDEQYIPKISEALDMSEEKVKEIFDYIMSFNPANQVLTPPYDGELGSEEVSDSFSNLLEMHCGNNQLDMNIELEDLRVNLNYVLGQLSEQEQKLLAYKYGFSGETECSYLALEKRMLLEGTPIPNGKTAVQSALYHLLSIILETKR